MLYRFCDIQRRIMAYLTMKSVAQNSENWKHSCFRRTAAHRDFFDYCALWILLFIYLLTYLWNLGYRPFKVIQNNTIR